MKQKIDWLNTPDCLQGKVLERKGCKLHYWIGGTGNDQPFLVMSHGATMDHRMFNAQVEKLHPDYRLLVWDARGHGLSVPLNGQFELSDCAEDLHAILQEEGVSEVVLIGQSMGGYISQYFYLGYPEKVKAMVVIGATSIAFAYPKWQVIALKASLPLFSLWPHRHFTETVARSTALKDDVRSYARKVLGDLDPHNFRAVWKAVTLSINEQGMPDFKINVPFLLTHGDRDNAGVIRKQAPSWAASEKDVRYLVIPDASHNANQDNPEFFNEVLVNFLAEITG